MPFQATSVRLPRRCNEIPRKRDLQWLLFACLDQSASRQFYVEVAVDSLSAYESRNEPKFFLMSEFIL